MVELTTLATSKLDLVNSTQPTINGGELYSDISISLLRKLAMRVLPELDSNERGEQ